MPINMTKLDMARQKLVRDKARQDANAAYDRLYWLMAYAAGLRIRVEHVDSDAGLRLISDLARDLRVRAEALVAEVS